MKLSVTEVSWSLWACVYLLSNAHCLGVRWGWAGEPVYVKTGKKMCQSECSSPVHSFPTPPPPPQVALSARHVTSAIQKKVFLARVLNQVVKAFIMVSVWACQSLRLEQALFLEGRHGNAAVSNPTASGSCYPGKGGASTTSESSTLFSLRHTHREYWLRLQKSLAVHSFLVRDVDSWAASFLVIDTCIHF